MTGNIAIYQTKDNHIEVTIDDKNETIWLNKNDIANLFGIDRSGVSRHISNIFKSAELDFKSNVQKMHIANSDKPVEFYNLDVILAVGYRANSGQAVAFRRWATRILKQYLVDGYAINELKIQKQQEQIGALKSAIYLLERSLNNQIETINDAKNAAKILKIFSKGLDLLDNFDHKTLDTKGETIKEAVKISKEEYLQVINEMKSEFASDVFANPKDNSFDSSINQIYQTFDGEELYKSLEEKAAMLLYLITKNHSFSDGNKRIAASCFLYFLDKNDILYKNNLPIIDNGTLFALTLLIAESDPKEMELMKQIVVSTLNQGGQNELGRME